MPQAQRSSVLARKICREGNNLERRDGNYIKRRDGNNIKRRDGNNIKKEGRAF